MKRLLHIVCTLLLAGASYFAASAQAVSDSVGVSAAGLDYGLHIVSYPAHGDEFTGLALEDGKAIPVKGKTLEMSFNLYNRPDNVFGCIFRIITDKGDNVDLMYHRPVAGGGRVSAAVRDGLPLRGRHARVRPVPV